MKIKKHKDTILEGFKKRGFESIQIVNTELELPWWIEERWIIKRKYDQWVLHVLFLTDLHWESGPKPVKEILLSTALISGYTDRSYRISSLDLTKGSFEINKQGFWNETDVFLNSEKSNNKST